ncbi:MAG: heparinase II/III family protein [Clostridia bacterium]|nr:heparinase II/III family protein [Clostridia bacterium]
MLIEKMRNEHPRLGHSKADMLAFRERAKLMENYADELARIRSEAEESAAEEPKEYAPYSNNAAGWGHLGNACGRFSNLYILGDSSYVGTLKKLAWHYAEFPTWCDSGIMEKKAPWHSDLNTTIFLNTYSSMYDLFYDEFSDDERRFLRDVMMKKGVEPLLNDWVLPGTRIHSLDSMGHNWWAVCIGSAVRALCAMYEDIDGSEELIEAGISALRRFCEYSGNPLLGKTPNFDEHGMFYEGALYFNYGIGELCNCLTAYKNCFETDLLAEFPVLRKAPDAFLALAYPTKHKDLRYLFADFGDSNIWIGGHSPMVKCMIGAGIADGNLKKFFLRAFGKPSIMEFMDPDLFSGKYGEEGERPVLPDAYYSEKGGIVTVRSSQDDDAFMLAARCGYSWNHAHADAGSFMIFRNGENIICDSSTTPSYGNKDYMRYFVQSEAHNVVLMDGEGMSGWNVSRGSRLQGYMRNFRKRGIFTYFAADCTGPTSQFCFRNIRNFFLLDTGLLVTVDDLTAYDERQFTYLLHHRGEASNSGQRTVIKSDSNTLFADLYIPGGFTYEERKDAGPSYSAFTSNAKTRPCSIFAVFSFDGSEAEADFSEGDRQYIADIRHGGNRYRLYYNREADSQRVHDAPINRLGDWYTDAYMLCDKNDGEEVFMVMGSFLRKDGKSYSEDLESRTDFII